MSYSSENLSVLAYSNSFTLWHYKTDDSAESIIEDSYFDDASYMLRLGDMILINAEINSTMKNGQIVVTENNDGIVKTSTMIEIK